jgi:hypothetical protein
MGFVDVGGLGAAWPSIPWTRRQETRTTRAAVVSVLAKYGCQERPQGWDTSFGGPVVPVRSLPIFVSVLTT